MNTQENYCDWCCICKKIAKNAKGNNKTSKETIKGGLIWIMFL